MQKILYIPSVRRDETRLVNRLRRPLDVFFDGQDGFFRGSLHAAFDVTERSFPYILKNKDRLDGFDHVVVNLKGDPRGKGLAYDDLKEISGIDIPKTLAVTNAEPENLPEERILDLFDTVFKREPFIDRGRYKVSAKNRDKIFATMLACPLVKAHKFGGAATAGFEMPEERKSLDLFFSGASTSKERIDVLNRLKHDGFNIEASVQPRAYKDELPPDLVGSRIPLRAFIEKARATRINLALSGYGPFTYRHLELWALCCFFISPAVIKELETPMKAVEGVHYAGFESLDDLADKCRHYLQNPAECAKIAQAGRELFAENYSFKKHGRDIESALAR